MDELGEFKRACVHESQARAGELEAQASRNRLDITLEALEEKQVSADARGKVAN